MSLWCAKLNKTSQNIKRQLADHTADMKLIILWRIWTPRILQLIISHKTD